MFLAPISDKFNCNAGDDMKVTFFLLPIGFCIIGRAAQSDTSKTIFNNYKKFKTINGLMKEFELKNNSDLVNLLERKFKEANIKLTQELPTCFFNKKKEIKCGEHVFSFDEKNNFKIDGKLVNHFNSFTDTIDAVNAIFSSTIVKNKTTSKWSLFLSLAWANSDVKFELVGPALVLQLQYQMLISEDSLSVACYNDKFYICKRLTRPQQLIDTTRRLRTTCVRYVENSTSTANPDPVTKFFKDWGFADILRGKTCNSETIAQVRSQFAQQDLRNSADDHYSLSESEAMAHLAQSIENNIDRFFREYSSFVNSHEHGSTHVIYRTREELLRGLTGIRK